MKLLMIAPANSSHTQKWLNFYQDKGYEIKLITFKSHNNKKLKNVEVISLPSYSKLSYLTNLFTIKKILKEFKPDIFHAHYISSYGLLAALTNFKPLFLSAWGSDVYRFPKRSFLHKKVIQFVLKQASTLCSTSEAMANEMKNYTNKNIEIIPFGVDINMFKPVHEKDNNNITIGIAKGLHAIYGYEELIRAVAILHKEFENIRLLIVGDGPKKKEYIELVEELGIKNKVTFCGSKSHEEMSDYINRMDIYAMPSHSESFGVAAVEAQSCSIPVVASNVGGIPEVVQNEITGILTEDHSIESLVCALKKLIISPELRKTYGKNGREFILENYNWINNAELVVELYNKYLKSEE